VKSRGYVILSGKQWPTHIILSILFVFLIAHFCSPPEIQVMGKYGLPERIAGCKPNGIARVSFPLNFPLSWGNSPLNQIQSYLTRSSIVSHWLLYLH